MESQTVIFTIFLIFTGAALLATLALYARQSLLVAYIVLGGLLGPHGFGWINDAATINGFAHVGIIFLLFLLGLNLYPQKLVAMLKKATLVTAVSSVSFCVIGIGIAYLSGFSLIDSLIIGAAMMFSSTIIGLKLMPTTTLHHQHAGEIVIAILLLQDLIAIFILMLINSVTSTNEDTIKHVIQMLLVVPGLFTMALIFERYILIRLIWRFDRIQEYIFLLAIGWCLGIAELAHAMGLSHEIGAFIAGVTVATSPIAKYIAEALKPLRDFFLVMFFFSLGATFDFQIVPTVMWPALILAATMLLVKPYIFGTMLKYVDETEKLAHETGVRLGQVSEFSLLVAYLALEKGLISAEASYLIQTTTIITFIVSSYWLVQNYPTPIAHNDDLRRD